MTLLWKREYEDYLICNLWTTPGKVIFSFYGNFCSHEKMENKKYQNAYWNHNLEVKETKRCDTLSLPFFANVKVFGIICVLASRSFHVYERFPYCLLWRLRDPKLVVLGPNLNDVLESCRQSGYCFYTYYFWGNNLQPSPLVIWRLLDRFSFKHSIYELLECLFCTSPHSLSIFQDKKE